MINPRLINLLKDAKILVYYQVLSLWTMLLFRIIMTFIISYLANSFIEESLSKIKLISGFIFFLFFLCSNYFLDKFYIRTTAQVSLSVKSILRQKIYSKLLRLGISYNENFATSNLVQLYVEGVDQLEVCFGQYFSIFVHNTVYIHQFSYS